MNDLDERKAKAVEESSALLVLYQEEIDKITEALKRSGKFKLGLDANSEAYAAINKEFDGRMSEIFDRYALPPGTRLKLW